MRGGDFIDGAEPGLLMARVILKDLPKRRMTALGAPGIHRAYAYLTDFARAAVALSRRDDLPVFADIPFPGHTFSLDDMAAEITRQTGGPMRITRFPWWAMRLASPVWGLAREMTEMRYLFDHPHSLGGAALAAHLPDFAPTPFADVVARHLPRTR